MSDNSAVPKKGNPDTLWRLIDSKCEQLRDAIRNARIAFLAALLCGFVWFTSLYNHEYGYPGKLLQRYELTLATLSKEESRPIQVLKDSWIGRYHKTFLDSLTKDSTMKSDTLCKKILNLQYEKLLQDQIDFWKIGIPGISSQLFIYDMGIIGQLGLLIILIWFYYATRRENSAVRSFVDIKEESQKLKWFPSKFTILPQQDLFLAEHYSYAYQAVAHRFMFLFSTISGPLLIVTIVLILFPALVSGWNFYTDIRDLINLHDKLGTEGIVRTMLGALLFAGVVIASFTCTRNSVQTSVILNGWYLANQCCWEPAWKKQLSEIAMPVRISRIEQTACIIDESFYESACL